MRSWSYCDFAVPFSARRMRQLPLGGLGLSVWITAVDTRFISSHNLLEEIWFIGSCLNQVTSNCSMMFLLLWQQKPQNAMTHFVPRPCIKILDTILFGIPRSASSSCTYTHRSLLSAARTRSTFSGVLLAAGLPECGLLSTESQPSLKLLCHTFICAALMASSLKVCWYIRIVTVEECSI